MKVAEDTQRCTVLESSCWPWSIRLFRFCPTKFPLFNTNLCHGNASLQDNILTAHLVDSKSPGSYPRDVDVSNAMNSLTSRMPEIREINTILRFYAIKES